MSNDAEKLRVFISYSRDDLDFADQLDTALRYYGFASTLDRHGISGGEDWQRRLSNLIRDADTVAFVLSPASAKSDICSWEVREAVRLGKRIIPVLCRPLDDASPPPQLQDLNYIFFYPDPKSPGSGFGTGLERLGTALNTDLEWLRDHTRYLQRATEWDAGGRPVNRLLSGADIGLAKTWAARRPKDAPAPTSLHLDFIRASEEAEAARADAAQRDLEERERLVKANELAQQEKAEASRRLIRRTLLGAIAALVLAVAASAAGFYAYLQRSEALTQKHEAEAHAARAEKSASEANAAQQEAVKKRDEALLTQSKFLADLSRQVADRGKILAPVCYSRWRRYPTRRVTTKLPGDGRIGRQPR
jgi:TIR domain